MIQWFETVNSMKGEFHPGKLLVELQLTFPYPPKPLACNPNLENPSVLCWKQLIVE